MQAPMIVIPMPPAMIIQMELTPVNVTIILLEMEHTVKVCVEHKMIILSILELYTMSLCTLSLLLVHRDSLLNVFKYLEISMCLFALYDDVT